MTIKRTVGVGGRLLQLLDLTGAQSTGIRREAVLAVPTRSEGRRVAVVLPSTLVAFTIRRARFAQHHLILFISKVRRPGICQYCCKAVTQALVLAGRGRTMALARY